MGDLIAGPPEIGFPKPVKVKKPRFSPRSRLVRPEPDSNIAFPKLFHEKTKKRKFKSERKKLIDKLDFVTSRIIRHREKDCVTCAAGLSKYAEAKAMGEELPNRGGLTNGHVFSRESYSLRWDVRPNGNCHTQCQSCNMSHEFDPYPYYKWFIDKFGLEQWEQLHIDYRRRVAHWKDWELEELYQKLLKIAEEEGVDLSVKKK
jgi:hypothetical protein